MAEGEERRAATTEHTAYPLALGIVFFFSFSKPLPPSTMAFQSIAAAAVPQLS